MLDTLEEWVSLIVGLVFVGFVFIVIAFFFRSPIVWLCLGLLTVLLFVCPIARSFLAIASIQRSRQRQDHQRDRRRSWKSQSYEEQLIILANKQKELAEPKIRQLPSPSEVETSSLDDPNVQTYVPPGLPPELFL